MKYFNVKVRLCKNVHLKVIADNELVAVKMVKDIIENNFICNNTPVKYKLQRINMLTKEEYKKKQRKKELTIPFIKISI